MRWLTKIEKHEFTYSSEMEAIDDRWQKLDDAIAKEGANGWEPWSVELKHSFNTAYTLLTTLAVVYYKRNDS